MQIKKMKPGPNQESVWDYPRPPRWEEVTKTIRVVAGGVTIANTTRAKRVLETSHPPVYYLPPEDVRMDLMSPTRHQSWCEWKGAATYLDLRVADCHIPNAAWTYTDPTPAFEEIRFHLAFYPQLMDACYVNDEQVEPQSGGFYGGWITSDIVGPFKGEPGTMGW